MNLGAYLNPFSEEYLSFYTSKLPYYWYSWDGKIIGRSFIMISIVLLLISIGLEKLWVKYNKTLVILFSALIGHIMVWAFAGFSGSRYLIAIDWIPLVLFGVGLVEMIKYVIYKFYRTSKFPLLEESMSDHERNQPERHRYQYVLEISLGISLIMIGLGPTILENKISKHYPDYQLAEKISLISASDDDILPSGESCFDRSDSDNGLKILYGQALYPRYYKEGEMIIDDRRETIKSPTNQRIDFYFVGTDNTGVTLPGADLISIFNHNVDAIVTGDFLQNRYIEARCVYLFEAGSDQPFTRRINCISEKCRLE